MGRAAGRLAEPERLLEAWRRILERRLSARLRARVRISIHDNTHTMVTFQRGHQGWDLRLHHMFLAASEEVLGALAAFVRTGDPVSSALLDRFIERNRIYIRRQSAKQIQRRLKLNPRGRFHDLEAILRHLNRRYFPGREIEVAITFGPAPRVTRPRKSIKLGSYSAGSRIIRIHPALDQRQVPRYFVEWIVFHEMLHHVYRVRRGADGRRIIHPPEFLEHERRFHAFERAQAWEREHLDLLLRAHMV
ncbi:MAG TPA: hypothetical protein VK013_04645 [Myxococcaceae bacterium]|nr:hypothetical protein [Myxococcaceae bacterium]